jgi:hypothetical protein
MALTVDFHEDLIDVPAPMAVATELVHSAAANLARKQRPKPVPPEPHRFVADVDPTLEQQIFDIPQTKRISNVHHHNQADDFRRRIEIAERAGWFSRSGHDHRPTQSASLFNQVHLL